MLSRVAEVDSRIADAKRDAAELREKFYSASALASEIPIRIKAKVSEYMLRSASGEAAVDMLRWKPKNA